jgi:hypothetical protein
MALPVVNMVFGRYVPAYDRPKVIRGFLALLLAGGLFYLSLDDEHDPYRVFHGLSQVRTAVLNTIRRITNSGMQVVVGVALFYLWQAVPDDQYKKHDSPLPRAYYRLD